MVRRLHILLGFVLLAALADPVRSAPADASPNDLFAADNQPKRWTVTLAEHERRTDSLAAEQDVRKKARDLFARRIAQLFPNTEWTPTQEFVDRQLIRHVTVNSRPADGEVLLYSADARLELTPEVRRDILRLLREEEARERQWLFLKGAILALTLCGLVAGYWHLRRRKNGGQTNWLRGAALIILALEGAGLWLM
jgi:hypothetical protein